MNAKSVKARVIEYEHDKEYDRTALMWAIRWKDTKAVEFLLSRMPKEEIGAELEKQDNSGWGWTPLHLACSSEPDFEILELLFEVGANPNIKDGNDEPPLIKAIQTANLSLVHFLLQHGANIKGKDGQAALEVAEAYGLIVIIELLKQAEAGK